MYIVKRKDGEYYQEDYTDIAGHRKSISVKIKGRSRLEKDKARKKLEDKLCSIGASDYRLSDIFKLYLAEQAQTLKESTVDRNEIALKCVIDLLGNVAVDKLTVGYVRTTFLKSGKSARTLNEYIKRLKAALRWAYRCELTENNAIVERLQPFPDTPTSQRNKYKYLEKSELKTLLNAMNNVRWKLVTEFLALSGLRIGELIALNNEDVTDTVIKVNKTMYHKTKTLTAPKTIDSTREIPIQNELKACISALKKAMLEQCLMYGYARTSYFVTSAEGGRITYDSYRKYLGDISMEVLGRRITPHVLRHTNVSLLAAADVPLDVIQRRLGHSDSQITRDVYLHITQERKDKDFKAVEKVYLLE